MFAPQGYYKQGSQVGKVKYGKVYPYLSRIYVTPAQKKNYFILAFSNNLLFDWEKDEYLAHSKLSHCLTVITYLTIILFLNKYAILDC